MKGRDYLKLVVNNPADRVFDIEAESKAFLREVSEKNYVKGQQEFCRIVLKIFPELLDESKPIDHELVTAYLRELIDLTLRIRV